MKVPFNIPYYTGKENRYIDRAKRSGHISSNGQYTKKCQSFFESRYGIGKTLLTTSCTDALEMAALLCKINPGDEVIVPSYTFVSTANAFATQGAKVVFADSLPDHPNIDPDRVEALITEYTKAIVVVHYAGIACDMDKLIDIANRHNLILIEDAAHAIDSKYKNRYLGSFGHLSTFSFHETKNITCGEGGMLGINDKSFMQRAEYIWEKGTNRLAFNRKEVTEYQWVDFGSSFAPSEITAAFLYAQTQKIDKIQDRRIELWEKYFEGLSFVEKAGAINIPDIPSYAMNNAHNFYFWVENETLRNDLLKYLNKKGIQAVFHYLPLHQSSFYQNKHDGRELPFAEKFAKQIIRLPFFPNLTEKKIAYVNSEIKNYFKV